ncbi:cyclic nucleotide-binding domain-containing protein [Spirulina major]|uniref:cyclic nucleotide-binding domain-containing protein n=1 Tax=Spirulina major TaxID=270636 RepID=UPI00093543F9|nr:cyclic nucleotide-binding domain-containing protein [Spirulina major]
MEPPKIGEILQQESTIVQQMILRPLAAGEVLFRRGDLGTAFYVIQSGRVRISTVDRQGQDIILNTMEAGESFGELALIDQLPRTATAIAMEPSTVLQLERDCFLQAIYDSPLLMQWVLQLMGDRARHMTEYIEHLGYWANQMIEGSYRQALTTIESVTTHTDERALIAASDSLAKVTEAVQSREELLRQQMQQPLVTIDPVKRDRDVRQITDTPYFQELLTLSRQLRRA